MTRATSNEYICPTKILIFMYGLTLSHPGHYHLQVQANPKKIVQKNDAIFSIYGRNRINPWHFFEFSLRPFEVVEAEGGRLVKEADFEAENFFLLKQKN